EGFASRTEDTSAANDWLQSTTPWEARVCATLLLKSSREEATAHSRARREALSSWPQPFAGSDFAWVTPPVLNPFTRIAVEMCAANGTLRAVGYESAPGEALPRRATQVRELAVAGVAAGAAGAAFSPARRARSKIFDMFLCPHGENRRSFF